MSKSIAIVNTATDTFQSWVTRTNDIVTFCNTEVVSVNSTVGVTAGNGFVTGIFGGNTIVASTVRGGNVTSSGNLAFSTNSSFSSLVRAEAGYTLQGDHGIIAANTWTAANTSQQVMDEFALATYRSAKYVISATDTAVPLTPKYQTTEIIVMHDDTVTYTTEYASLVSNGTLLAISSDISGANVRILVTPTTASMVAKFEKVLIAV